MFIERCLRTQCLAGRDPQRLLAFDLPDRAGGVEHLISVRTIVDHERPMGSRVTRWMLERRP
jgi:hypothetical protein